MAEKLNLYKMYNGEEQVFPDSAFPAYLLSYEYQTSRMGGVPTITASFTYPENIDALFEGDNKVYVKFRGEKYYAKNKPSSSYSNTDIAYHYEIEFVSERQILNETYFIDAVQEDSETDSYRSNTTEIFFMGNLEEFAGRLRSTLAYSNIDYSVVIDEGIETTENKQVQFSNLYIIPALQEAYNIFGIPCYFVGKVIHFGFYEESIAHVFKYGVDDALMSVSRENTNAYIVRRCSGTGSSENIPYYYPNKTAKGDVGIKVLSGNLEGLTVLDSQKFSDGVLINSPIEYVKHTVSSASDVHVDSLHVRQRDKRYPYDYTNEYVPWDLDGTQSVICLFVTKSVDTNTYNAYIEYEFTLGITVDAPGKLTLNCTPEFLGVRSNNHTAIGNGGYDLHGTGKITVQFTNLTENVYSPGKHEINGVLRADIQSRYAFYDASIYAGPDFTLRFFAAITDETYRWENNGTPVNLVDIGIGYEGTANFQVGDKFTQEVISYIPSVPNLMPPIYRESGGKNRFYNALNNTYKDEKDAYYTFANLYSESNRGEYIQAFEDIKPTIHNITNAAGARIDTLLDVAFDEQDNDEVDAEGKYIHPYFFVKLRKFDGDNGFNLFDHASESGDMTISMTNGVCGACQFVIQVDDDNKNTVQVDSSGNLRRDSNGNVQFGTPQDRQNNTQTNEVWLALAKDDSTYTNVMPNHNMNLAPKAGDEFVLTNINMPDAYIYAAEEELEKAIIKFMHEHNDDIYNISVSLSRIFFKEFPDIETSLNENSLITVQYGGKNIHAYVSDYTYRVSDDSPLPEIAITLTEELAAEESSISNLVDAVKDNVVEGVVNGQALLSFMRKDIDETMPNIMTFLKDVVLSAGKSLISQSGAASFANGKAFTDSQGNAQLASLVVQSILSVANGNFSVDNDGSLHISDNKAFINAQGYAELMQLVLRLGITSPTFTTGALGSGFCLQRTETGDSYLEVDRMLVRKVATFIQLMIQEIKHVGGQILLTPASMQCYEVQDNGSFYRCYFRNNDENRQIENQFVVGDLARCQTFNVKEGLNENVTNTYYWRAVIAVGDDYIDLSATDCDSGSTVPQAGDEIVQLGNKTDTTRQSAIILAAFGEDSPYIKLYRGINSYSLEGKEIITISRSMVKIIADKLEFSTGESVNDAISNAIVGVDVEYALSDSATVAPVSGWSTTAPEWEADKYMWQRTVTTTSKGTSYSAPTCIQGAKGEDGADGADGVPGADGKDGKTLYTWIRYADNAAGAGISNDPTGKAFIGFAYNKESAAESDTPSDYTWSEIKGEQGVPGATGADGKTLYTWIAYSDNANGTPMYQQPKDTTQYIGIATNKESATESTNPGDYTWSKFKGEKGDKGDQGERGLQGLQGEKGEQGIPGNPGKTLYTWIRYADNAQGGGISNDPTGKAFIGFAYNKETATESNTPTDYTWSEIKGEQGVKGDKGDDGTQYYTWIKYSDNASGSRMYDTPKATTQYIGIAVNKTSPTESNTPTDYTWSKFKGDKGEQGEKGEQGPQGIPGTDGADGRTSYFHIKYSTKSNPTSAADMTETPSDYIGTYVDYTEADSTNPSKYTWARFKGIQGDKGDQGIPGTNGADGKTYYLHIAYANSADGSQGFSTTDSANKLYIGQYTDTTQADSTDYKKYSWTKIKGDQGDTGKGVKALEEQYYLSTSNTSQTGGSWQTACPAWQSGKYIWTRTKVTWTDDTITYTTPVLAEDINDLGGKLDQAVKDLAENIEFVDSLSEDLETVKKQVDGAIETWFYTPVPTLNNPPASSWTTTDLKNQHLGDLYYSGEGKAYRFQMSGSNYVWQVITDTDITKALANAQKAQDTADGKRRVFVNAPTNASAYDVGDLWVNATYGSYSNDLLRCKTAKAAGSAWSINHWEKASKYTDDTLAQQALDAASDAQEDATKAQTDANAAQQKANEAQEDADAANEAASTAQAAADAANKAASTAQTAANEAKSSLSAIMSDSIITPPEKTALKQQHSDVVSEYNQIVAEAQKYSLSTTAYTSAYNLAVQAYNKYTAATPQNITVAADYNNISAYYTARLTILNAIANAAKKAADDAQKAADAAQDTADAADKAADAAQKAADEAQAAADNAASTAGQAMTAAQNAQRDANAAASAANSANSAINGVINFTNTAFADGVVDRAEAVAIEKYLNTIDATKKELNGTYSVVYNNENLSGTAKTNLNTAFSAVSNAIQTLIDKINVAIADSVASAAEKTQVNDAYEAFNEKLQAYNDALEEANKFIQELLSKKAMLLSTATMGKMLNTDPEFKDGLNGILSYQVGIDSSASHSLKRVQLTGAPNSSGYVIELKSKYSKSPASQAQRFGFAFSTRTKANGMFICRFIAKIPDNAYVQFITNATGNNPTRMPLTSMQGTGDWEEYSYYVKCGADGTFSTTFFFYIVYPTLNEEFTWQVAYATVFDVSSANSIVEDFNELQEQVVQLDSNLDNLSSDLTGLKNLTDTSFKDKVVDEAEKIAISKYLNIVNESWKNLEASYNVVYNNEYLTGADKTALYNAYTTLVNRKNSLISSINTAMSKPTDANITAVDTAYDNYTTAVTSFQTAIEEANKFISDAIRTQIESAVPYTEKIIDTTALDQNSWYPITIWMHNTGITYTIHVWHNFNDTRPKPSWSTHNQGFYMNCRWTTNPHSWGIATVRRSILNYAQNWPRYEEGGFVIAGKIGQMTRASREYIYVRGGAKYRIRVDGESNMEIILRKSTITISSDTITAPITEASQITLPVSDIDVVKNNAKAAQEAADDAAEVAQTAKDRLDKWAEDGVISPVEKQSLKDEIKRIGSDYSEISANCKKYGITLPTTFSSAYTSYKSNLTTLTALTPEYITIPTSFSVNQTNYYNYRSQILQQIAAKAWDAVETVDDDLQGYKSTVEGKFTATNEAITSAITTTKEYVNKNIGRLTVLGTNYKLDNSTTGNKECYMMLNDKKYSQTTIGFYVYKVLLSNLTVTYVGNYNTYSGGATTCTTMANAINAIDENYIVVVFTYDAVMLNATLQTCLNNYGGDAPLYTSSTRVSYVLIGQKGIGKGNGLQQYSLEKRVKISTNIINGNCVGFFGQGNLAESLDNTSSELATYKSTTNATLSTMQDSIEASVKTTELKEKITALNTFATTTSVTQAIELNNDNLQLSSVKNLNTAVTNINGDIAAMESRLSQAEIKLQPDNIKLTVEEQTETIVNNAIDGIKTYGNNICANGELNLSQVALYYVTPLYMFDELVAGQTYTAMIKAKLSDFSGAWINFWESNAGISQGGAIYASDFNEKGIARKVFTYNPAANSNHRFIRLYNGPGTSAADHPLDLEWICIYEGDVKAPEEFVTPSPKGYTLDGINLLPFSKMDSMDDKQKWAISSGVITSIVSGAMNIMNLQTVRDNKGIYMDLPDDVVLDELETVVFQFEYKLMSGSNVTNNFNVGVQNSLTNYTVALSLTNSWQKYAAKQVIPINYNRRIVFYWGVNTGTETSNIMLRNLKLERGSKASEWTPNMKTELVRTGIDIESRKITITADNTEFRANNGQLAARITTEGLITAGVETFRNENGSARIRGGLFEILDGNDNVCFKFGMQNGFGVLSYYKDGKELYNFGPNGITLLNNNQAAKWTDNTVIMPLRLYNPGNAMPYFTFYDSEYGSTVTRFGYKKAHNVQIYQAAMTNGKYTDTASAAYDGKRVWDRLLSEKTSDNVYFNMAVGYCIIGTISGTAITWNNRVRFLSRGTLNEDLDYAANYACKVYGVAEGSISGTVSTAGLPTSTNANVRDGSPRGYTIAASASTDGNYIGTVSSTNYAIHLEQGDEFTENHPYQEIYD